MRGLTDKSLATFVGGKEPFLPAAATDMAGAAHKTPSPGLSTPNTDHTYGQPTPLVGADESHAPQAR
jgi:hypothetical protein